MGALIKGPHQPPVHHGNIVPRGLRVVGPSVPGGVSVSVGRWRELRPRH